MSDICDFVNNQPGIVFGLGVRSIPAPEYASVQYRDGRWLEIKPGIAIDLQGNPIVVPELETYRIASENLSPKKKASVEAFCLFTTAMTTGCPTAWPAFP